MWPWPLTYGRDLWTHPRYCKGSYPYQIIFKFIAPTAQLLECWQMHRQTDRQTDRQTGPIVLPRPLTREVMKQLDIVRRPPTFVWTPYLTLTRVTYDLDPFDLWSPYRISCSPDGWSRRDLHFCSLRIRHIPKLDGRKRKKKEIIVYQKRIHAGRKIFNFWSFCRSCQKRLSQLYWPK